jgi:hypothetical protein
MAHPPMPPKATASCAARVPTKSAIEAPDELAKALLDFTAGVDAA